MAKDKLGWLKKITKPMSGKKVSAILGFFNFFRDFIPNYVRVAAPLEELRRKKVIIEKDWKPECQKAFQDLKILLESAPPLSQPNFDEEFQVVMDTSQFGIGVVLYQKIKGKIKYIDFGGGSLKGGQKNYPAVKQELLAIIFALKRWRHLLLGRRFCIKIDHKALEYLNQLKNFMILDWLHFLLNFNFYVIHSKRMNYVLLNSFS